MRFILTVIIFIGLKFWELSKFLWKTIDGIFYYNWKMILVAVIVIGSFWGFIFGWAIFIDLQAQYFNIPHDIMLLYNLIGFVCLICIGLSLTFYWKEIKYFSPIIGLRRKE